MKKDADKCVHLAKVRARSGTQKKLQDSSPGARVLQELPKTSDDVDARLPPWAVWLLGEYQKAKRDLRVVV